MKMHDKDEESIILDEEQRSWDWKWSEEDENLEFWVIERRREVYLSREIKENGSEIPKHEFIETS